MKRSLTLCAVATILIGVSVPAAAIGGPLTSAPATATGSRIDASAQTFAASQTVAAAPVTRDSFGVETVKQQVAVAAAYTAVTGKLAVWPGDGNIKDGFGYRDGGEFHGGVDIMAPGGSNIVAAQSGTVIEVNQDSGWGQYVKIDHGNGIATLYAHMVSGSPVVSVGQAVQAGELLGIVGQTGYATVAHLHFEVYVDGVRVDPAGWLP